MNFWLFLIPVISAFIGWFTNWIAIKMLFHPRQPKTFAGVTFQGIFPKRQRQFAEKLGRLVSTELLSFSDIESKITSPDNLKKVMPLVEGHVDHFLNTKLKEEMPMIGMLVGEKTLAMMKEVFMREMEELFPIVMHNYINHLETDLDLEKIVIERVSTFSSDKLEAILNQIMQREFRFVEIIGGVLGFAIGIFQVIITLLSQ